MSGQSQFRESLLDPRAPVPEGLVGPEGQAAPKRFAVYRNNVVHSLIGAMKDAYPAIQANVGADFFEAMAGLYVRENPPLSPMMMFYGESFPEFLAGFKPAAARPYLPDLATLELVMRQSYHSADDLAFDPAVLAEIDEDALMAKRFDLQASTTIFRSDHPVLSYWMHHIQGAQKPEDEAPEFILITRPALDVSLTALSEAQYKFFETLSTGKTLEASFDVATGIEAEFNLGEALGIAFQTAALRADA